MQIHALDDDLDALGYVKVIIVLAPAAVGGAAAVSSPTVNAPDNSASAVTSGRDLGDYFITPPGAQVGDLPAAAGQVGPGTAAKPRCYREYPHLGLALGYVDRNGAQALNIDARVALVVRAPELSLIRPVARAAAAPPRRATWGIQRLGVEALWTAGYTGRGVVVGHLDTGMDASHPALNGALKAFTEFDLAGDPVPGAQARDSGWHGTHTAGTIAGRRGPHGAIGVAPEAQIMSGLVIEGGNVIDRILAGLEWLVSEGVRIVSLSLGVRGYTPAFQVVINALRANNVLPVIAVGNEFAGTSRSPGNYANVLSVGACNQQDQVADFSSSQQFAREDDPLVPDLVAPGVAVLSCAPGDNYYESDGTSMATPHIAGLAAVLLQARPDASALDLETAILGSCARAGTMPLERANRGIPDAAKALSLLTGTAR